MKKRAMSYIVGVVFILLVTFFSISLIWFFIVPFLEDHTSLFTEDNVEISIITIEGYTVWDEENEYLSVQVERGFDNESLIGLQFSFMVERSSVNKIIYEYPLPLSKKVFRFDASSLGGRPSSIGVAVVYPDGSIDQMIYLKLNIPKGVVEGDLINLGDKWYLANGGRPISGSYYLDSSAKYLTKSINSNGDLIYFFDTDIFGTIAGRLTSDMEWEIFSKDGWVSSGNSFPESFSYSFFGGIKRLYTNVANHPIFGVSHFGRYLVRYGKLGLDIHGAYVNFAFDSEKGFSRWTGFMNYGKEDYKGILSSSWNNIELDFAYNGVDSGIALASYGYTLGNGNYSRITAIKYFEDPLLNQYNSYWNIWNGSGWGPGSESFSSYTKYHMIPKDFEWTSDENRLTYGQLSPSIDYIGDKEYIGVYVSNNYIYGLYYKDESPYFWKYWNGSDWSSDISYSYEPLIEDSFSSSNKIKSFVSGKDVHFTYSSGGVVYDLYYDYDKNNFIKEVLIPSADSYDIIKKDENFYLTYSLEGSIYLRKGDFSNWDYEKEVYSSSGFKVENINFIEDYLVIFLRKDNKLYAIMENIYKGVEMDFNMKSILYAPLFIRGVSYNRSWSDIPSIGIHYSAQTAGTLAIDSEGFIFSPHTKVCGVAIFNSSNISQNYVWGGFWDYFQEPLSVEISDKFGKVYFSDAPIPQSGSGAYGFGGRVQIWNLSNKTNNFWKSDYGSLFSKQGLVKPEIYYPSYVSGYKYPTDIAIDEVNNFLYVTESPLNRVTKHSLNSQGYPTRIGFIGSEGSLNSQMIFPMGIDVDLEGNLYVVDTGNQRIQKFDSNGDHKLTFGSFGTSVGQMIYPVGISVNSRNIFVTDAFRKAVLIYDLEGRFIGEFNSFGSEESFDREISGIVSTEEKLYVGANSRIYEFDLGEIYLPEHCEDIDLDGYYFGDDCGILDCDDSCSDVFPGAIERCDLIDSDCDGVINNDLFDIEGCSNLGSCSGSYRTCNELGEWSECSILPTEEICDGLDDNCNGFIDEELGCTSDLKIICGKLDFDENGLVSFRDYFVMNKYLYQDISCNSSNFYCNHTDVDLDGYVDYDDYCAFISVYYSLTFRDKLENTCSNRSSSTFRIVPNNEIYYIDLGGTCLPL